MITVVLAVLTYISLSTTSMVNVRLALMVLSALPSASPAQTLRTEAETAPAFQLRLSP
jgi:hypothetical protein